MENSTLDEFCIKNGVDIVTYPYYRAMQIIHIVLSIGSVVLILWVLKKYRKKLIFHYNIRILVTSLFFASLLHATLMTIFECYQLYLSFTYVKPCDVVLPRLFYIIVHMPFIFSVMWIEATQMVILIERAIAMLYVGEYESCTKKLGNSLLVLTLVTPLLECLWAYIGEPFLAPEINCLNTPLNRANKIKALFLFSLSFHLVAFAAMAIMFFIHKRKSRTARTLTSRFQFSENLMSSRLLITLSGIQLFIFFTYASSIIYLMMTFNPETSMPVYRSNILAAYVVPVYTFMLPLITTVFLWRMKHTRRSEIRSMIQVKASGAEGWANYSNQLQQQWNS
ncbi:integral membrane protein Srb [Ancylostoma caninum]|uniref:Integral membrane protein Srb n=1 Tax=Ancylostoma caninum TaxID=29170 RepID=A0A368GAH8_ANCCA|nr:integral membrane protein Srb [Ancylostoma caninum]